MFLFAIRWVVPGKRIRLPLRSEALPLRASGNFPRTCAQQLRGGRMSSSKLPTVRAAGLALTEDWPVIFAYQENRWAELEDARFGAVSTSLDLLDALHIRWVRLFSSLREQDWKRGYTHPENGRQSVEQAVILYDWHGRHHTAHVTQLAARRGWS
jgi:hypothetical protein